MNAGFSTVFAALFVAHQVGDHWVQSQGQADGKGKPGWAGRWACLAHVTTYTLTCAVLVLLVATCSGMPLSAGRLVLGLGVTAVTHYLADRRTPMVWMCSQLRKSPVWLTQFGGFYAMDQSWHYGWLLVTALIVA